MRLTVVAPLVALVCASPAWAGTDFALHRAIVESSRDPQRAYRLLVRVPDVSNVTEWANPSVPYTADPRLIALPPSGEVVWVLFEGGDISQPVWIGWRPNGTEAPPARLTPFGRRRP